MLSESEGGDPRVLGQPGLYETLNEQTNKQNNINKRSGVGLGLMACKPTTQEAEARGCQVGDQPGLHKKTCQKGKKNIVGKALYYFFFIPQCVFVCVCTVEDL